MSQFKDKVVLVTGASSGIGWALALEFARRGADLVLAARRTDRMEELARSIEGMGRRAVAVACDVTVDGDVEKAVAAGREAFGRPIDVAVANAGFGVAGRVDQLSVDDFRRQFETNVFGVLRTFHAVRLDLETTRGRFAIVGSVTGHMAAPTTAPYSMSKFAIRALADALRAELRRRGVAVTLLSPGFIASEIRRVDNQGVFKSTRKEPIPAWLILSAESCARKMVRAIARRRRERIITGHGKLVVWLSRTCPWLLAVLLERFASAEGPPHRPRPA